jgi:hypothetical protein
VDVDVGRGRLRRPRSPLPRLIVNYTLATGTGGTLASPSFPTAFTIPRTRLPCLLTTPGYTKNSLMKTVHSKGAHHLLYY